jgi:heptose I phosphotransferase
MPAEWADSIMSAPVTDRFHQKQGRSTGRWVLSRNGRSLTVYLKRHYRLEWWRCILAILRPGGAWSPAVQEWNHLRFARRQGWQVPRALAVGEIVGPGLRLASFLAIEELTGMEGLHDLIPEAYRRLPAAEFDRWKAAGVRELARVVALLHEGGWFHKDLYLCHFYVPVSSVHQAGVRRGEVYMIDLHRLGRHRLTRAWWQVKDLGQLLYSSFILGVTARDRLRFWKYYCRALGVAGKRRWLLRLIEWKASRYRDHNQKQKRSAAAAA